MSEGPRRPGYSRKASRQAKTPSHVRGFLGGLPEEGPESRSEFRKVQRLNDIRLARKLKTWGIEHGYVAGIRSLDFGIPYATFDNPTGPLDAIAKLEIYFINEFKAGRLTKISSLRTLLKEGYNPEQESLIEAIERNNLQPPVPLAEARRRAVNLRHVKAFPSDQLSHLVRHVATHVMQDRREKRRMQMEARARRA